MKHEVKEVEKEMRQMKKVNKRSKNHTWKKMTGIGKSIGELISKK